MSSKMSNGKSPREIALLNDRTNKKTIKKTLFDHTIQNGGLKRLEVLQRNKLN